MPDLLQFPISTRLRWPVKKEERLAVLALKENWYIRKLAGGEDSSKMLLPGVRSMDHRTQSASFLNYLLNTFVIPCTDGECSEHATNIQKLPHPPIPFGSPYCETHKPESTLPFGYRSLNSLNRIQQRNGTYQLNKLLGLKGTVTDKKAYTLFERLADTHTYQEYQNLVDLFEQVLDLELNDWEAKLRGVELMPRSIEFLRNALQLNPHPPLEQIIESPFTEPKPEKPDALKYKQMNLF